MIGIGWHAFRIASYYAWLALVTKPAILSIGLAAVVCSTQTLPVASIPEQVHVALVWHNVINICGWLSMPKQ
jgi:hypothetical protein